MKYSEETFSDLVKKSYGYSEKEQQTNAWRVANALYEKNYVYYTGLNQRIPKRIHQIWLGTKPMPEQYKKFSETWKKHHPDWDYKLWTDADAVLFPMEKRAVFNSINNVGAKSDIFRYEILKKYGGLYIDTDFECLKTFDDLLYLDFFTGISYDDVFILYNGLIATVPQHPIIQKCVSNLTAPKGQYRRPSQIMNITGPYYFTRCFNESVDENTERIVAMPMEYFYPLPNNDVNASNPYSYVKPHSYAIHHWAVSWM